LAQVRLLDEHLVVAGLAHKDGLVPGRLADQKMEEGLSRVFLVADQMKGFGVGQVVLVEVALRGRGGPGFALEFGNGVEVFVNGVLLDGRVEVGGHAPLVGLGVQGQRELLIGLLAGIEVHLGDVALGHALGRQRHQSRLFDDAWRVLGGLLVREQRHQNGQHNHQRNQILGFHAQPPRNRVSGIG
jgi:hypothetical protein